MKIELKKYERKYFFKFVFNMLNYKLLKNAGYLSLNNWIQIIKNRKSKCYKFMVLMDKKIVGGVSLIKEVKTKEWVLGGLIFKKYWNRGIATTAIKKLLIYAKKKGIKRVEGEVFKNNYSSMKLVKKVGFKKN